MHLVLASLSSWQTIREFQAAPEVERHWPVTQVRMKARVVPRAVSIGAKGQSQYTRKERCTFGSAPIVGIRPVASTPTNSNGRIGLAACDRRAQIQLPEAGLTQHSTGYSDAATIECPGATVTCRSWRTPLLCEK